MTLIDNKIRMSFGYLCPSAAHALEPRLLDQLGGGETFWILKNRSAIARSDRLCFRAVLQKLVDTRHYKTSFCGFQTQGRRNDPGPFQRRFSVLKIQIFLGDRA